MRLAIRSHFGYTPRAGRGTSNESGAIVYKNLGCALATLAAIAVASTPAPAVDDFPIVGTYAKDEVCKGDGSDRPELLVRITASEILSSLGSCKILNKRRDGRAFSAHVECKMQNDQVILGDVTFKQRDDNTLDFDDQDHTSPAVLYKCAK